jgi:hypothetical protein
MSAVGELGMFVGTILLNLYENEVEGLGPGPRRCGGAVVATAPGRTPYKWHNAETKTSMPSSSGTPAYILQGGTSSLIL